MLGIALFPALIAGIIGYTGSTGAAQRETSVTTVQSEIVGCDGGSETIPMSTRGERCVPSAIYPLSSRPPEEHVRAT